MKYEWLDEWEIPSFFSFGPPVKRRRFKLEDGREFVASGVNAIITGWEVAICTNHNGNEEWDFVMEPIRVSWDEAVKHFIDNYLDTEKE